MKHDRINFTDDGRVNMLTYIHDVSDQKASTFESWRKGKEKRPSDYWQIQKRPAIIILPGGAYSMLSDREAEPVALTFMKEGFNAFVLNYSLGDDSAYPGPLEDVSKAIWEVRKNADAWAVDENAITVMGFSAGAHLAALISTQWNQSGLAERLEIPFSGNKPNAAVIGYGLVYPEITGTDELKIELGEMLADPPKEFECHRYIGSHVPPMFIWHTCYDPLVPAKNALDLASALNDKALPYELHIFQKGTHGMSVCNDLSDFLAPEAVRPKNAGSWVELCTQWIKELFIIP